jgi:hypothetical protein
MDPDRVAGVRQGPDCRIENVHQGEKPLHSRYNLHHRFIFSCRTPMSGGIW